ncbi:hypothetical protein EVAR_67251_1 [Eumeta japonica]|uniref:Uncharacterized protein n=1 Tax=Eumeta variegata TaxID=151549 RepID=A0A4C1YVR6_EUMVA|nr:hypothetical protein EVAR_67251_1 [Eumeta japonica]
MGISRLYGLKVRNQILTWVTESWRRPKVARRVGGARGGNNLEPALTAARCAPPAPRGRPPPAAPSSPTHYCI